VSGLRTRRPGDQGSISIGARYLCLKHPDQLWGSLRILFSVYREALSMG